MFTSFIDNVLNLLDQSEEFLVITKDILKTLRNISDLKGSDIINHWSVIWPNFFEFPEYQLNGLFEVVEPHPYFIEVDFDIYCIFSVLVVPSIEGA